MPLSRELLRLVFVGLSGYSYPHTRVRCFHFAEALGKYPDVDTQVLSYRDHLCPEKSEVDMFDNLRDREKIKLVMKAVSRLRKEDPRAVFYIQKAHYHSAAPYLLHRLFKRKFIFDYDDYDVELSVFFGRGTWNRLFFGTRDWNVITERFASRATACVASSHLLYDFLKAYNPRTYLVPTGVNPEQFHPRPVGQASSQEGEEVVFLWTGIVWGEEIFRSVMEILKAFGQVASQCPKVRLKIVGGGQRMEELQQHVNEHYRTLKIEFLGWRAPTEMPEILRQADIGLLPFAGDSRWIQSKSPTKLFEYMASGLAVVASGVGEVNHVIDDGQDGLLVYKTGSFAEKMFQLATDPQLRQRLGESARRKVVHEYSLPKLGEALYGMLSDLRNEGLV